MEKIGGFDRGISPFIRTLQGQRYKTAGVKELQHQRNSVLTIHPQILTNQAEDFIYLAKVFFDLGYPIVNLNMGCPVPTAAGRGVLYDPLLLRKISGDDSPSREPIFEFFRSLATHYLKAKVDDHVALARMKTLVVYLGVGLEFPKAALRKIRKIKNVPGLLEEVAILLS
jgi:tRNA-dihydrouridine synthase